MLRGFGHVVPLAVHGVLSDVFRLDGLEGARTHMERERFVQDTPVGEGGHQLWREVQRGGGRGDGPFFPRKHRLIIFLIAFIDRAARGDIGGERHGPCPFEQDFHRLLPFKMEEQASVCCAVARNGGHAAAENNLIPLTQALGIFHKGPPIAQPFTFMQGRADFCLTPPTFQLGRDDARVVKDKAITGGKQAGQITHDQVARFAPLKMQQARTIPRNSRAQGNQLLRESEIKQVNAHGLRLCRPVLRCGLCRCSWRSDGRQGRARGIRAICFYPGLHNGRWRGGGFPPVDRIDKLHAR